jgi:hypothetical protein
MAQALAWIIYRKPEAVSQTPRSKDVWDVANEAARREGIDADLVSADLRKRFELLDHLKRGTLTAWGIAREHSEHTPIPATSWDTIDSFYTYNPQSNIGPCDVGNSDESSARYRDVFVKPLDIRNRWPRLDASLKLASNERKRLAVDAAIETLGVDVLVAMPQKVREHKIIATVKATEGGLSVTDRYVRERLSNAKKERTRS